MYQFESSEKEDAQLLREKLDKAIAFFNYTNLSTSTDYYAPGINFVIVHGLSTKLGARGFGDVLKEHKDYKISKEHFEISSPNYKIIQIHKNLADYLNTGEGAPKNTNSKK